MEDRSTNCLPGDTKSWYRRLFDFFFQKEACPCGEGAACAGKACSCNCNERCAIQEWTEDSNGIEKPDRPTLNTVPVGGKAHIEKLFLPLALKKRLLSLGLTYGTEVAVICNERGRMIIAVRDSRLGLSPEVASKITYMSA